MAVPGQVEQQGSGLTRFGATIGLANGRRDGVGGLGRRDNAFGAGEQDAGLLPYTINPTIPAPLIQLGGIVVLGLIALFLWGMAAWISRGGAEATERIVTLETDVRHTLAFHPASFLPHSGISNS